MTAEGLGGHLCFMYDDVKTTHTHNRIWFHGDFYNTDLGVVGAASRLEQQPILLLWAEEVPLPALLEWTLAWRPVRHHDFCDWRQKYALLLSLSLEKKCMHSH